MTVLPTIYQYESSFNIFDTKKKTDFKKCQYATNTLTPANDGSSCRRRKSTPTVQNSSRVAEEVRVSPRTAYLSRLHCTNTNNTQVELGETPDDIKVCDFICFS